MNILAFDTSTPTLLLGLLSEQQIYLKNYETPNTHNTLLLKEIDALLQDHQLQSQDLDILAMVNGPGSFTGLRVGSCLLKTWGYLLNIKIISLNVFQWLSFYQSSNFDTQASQISRSDPQFLLIDGNNKTFYLQVYQNNDSINPISPMINIRLTEIENDSLWKVIQKKMAVTCSPNNKINLTKAPTKIYSWECSQAIQQTLQKQDIDLVTYKRDLKNYLELVAKQYQENNFLDPLLFKPIYDHQESK